MALSALASDVLATVRRLSHADVNSAAFDPLKMGWTAGELNKGLTLLARRSGLCRTDLIHAPAGASEVPDEDIPAWIDWAACQLGAEAEQVQTTIADLPRSMASLGPSVIRISTAAGARWILVRRCRGRFLHVLTPLDKLISVPATSLIDYLTAPHERPMRRELDRLLDAATSDDPERERLRRALLRDRLGGQIIDGLHILRLPPTAAITRQFARLGMLQRLSAAIALNILVYGIEIFAWALIGGSLLAGRLDFGVLAAWGLLLCSMVVLRGWGGRSIAMLATDFGRTIKTRLLAGALNGDADEIRRAGTGHLLARVMESQAFEMLAVGGGLAAIAAVIELAYAFLLLFGSAGGVAAGFLLMAWSAIGLFFGIVYWRRLRQWTSSRLDLTHDLVERMVGHRTILVQEPAEHRLILDRQLGHYHAISEQVDAAAIPVTAALPSAWLLIGLAVVVPAFVWGNLSNTQLAVAVGGILFAARALASVAESLASGSRALIAWNEIRPLVETGGEAVRPGPFLRSSTVDVTTPFIEVSGVHFARATRPVLKGASLKIAMGERILLTGPSGSGKSTLAALLLGARDADGGKLTLGGLPREGYGQAWHGLVAGAPQFHENHILTGSLAFNLLLGRRWPATESDLEEARLVCEELGLGPLLDRMPAGLEQMVGETGWQLSHGEKSRIYLARALLQGVSLTILDESFAALDPETARLCVECVTRRAPTLMVIAHP